MLRPEFFSIMQSNSRDIYRDELVRFAKHAGFDFVAVAVVLDHVVGDTRFIGVNNTPDDYLAAFEEADICRRDPVMQHCKLHSVPIVWDQRTYTAACAGELWEEQAHFGYRTGIALALHLPKGRHFVVGVDRDQELPSDTAELTRMVADLQLFGVYAMDAAMRLLLPDQQQADRPGLTAREVECLSRTMDGKTAWEVGNVLGITERTAVLHLQTAMRKLGCVSKHQAVLKALRLGLIR